MTSAGGHVVALCGGIGGAKMAFGLSRILGPDDLTVVVNTGDDLEHLGLAISPDLDTVTYTLAELSDRERGWGLAGETWNFMSALARLGGEAWFRLGDHDLALHVERTRLLAAGESLSAVTATLTRRLGLRHAIAPMSDQPVRTWVDTTDGPLAFQHYFVREQCRPAVRGVRFVGAAQARPSPVVAAALARPDLAAILICPSNPYLSIDPILAVPGLAEAVRASGVPCVAVSPIVGGEAIKGPSAKMMREMGIIPSAREVAAHYAHLIDGLILDLVDFDQAPAIEALGIATLATATIMRTDADRVSLASDALAFSLAPGVRKSEGRSMTHVVIAVRGGPDAKSRCATALSGVERANLVEVMLEDMLDTIARAAGVTEVWVVTPTAAVAAVATRRGARVVRQGEPAKLNSGFEQALDVLAEEAPYASVALLLGDLPLLAANELEAVIALAKTHSVVLAPTLSDGGTSAIVLTAGARFRMAFGRDSFRRHAAIARGSGLSVAVVEAKSLSRDVDWPEDLFAVMEASPASRTGRFLRERLSRRVGG